MASSSLAPGLSQAHIDEIVLESSEILQVLGLPSKQDVIRHIPTFQTVAPEKLKAFLRDCNCGWK